MSIRILPDSEIQQAASSFYSPALLFANPKTLYLRRAKRLRELAENSPFADYLDFAANLVDVQADLLHTQPLADFSLDLTACSTVKPLNAKTWQRSGEWRKLLLSLIEKFKPYANDTMLPTLEWLEKAADSELEKLADSLLHERFEEVPADKAVFLWAALSLYWTQLAQQLPRHAETHVGERHTCPICDASPVSGLVQFGEAQGLRYLHCSLCETEWHVVRAKCTCCDQARDLNYWSLDKHDAAVRAESCGDCQSYIKTLYQDKDPAVEAVADDLATLFLDAEMEEKGFYRSGLNPFLFQASE